jgi:DNA-directed RNA polymerase subunit F
MIGKDPKGPNHVPLYEVIEIIKERKKHGELGYEQTVALEHAEKFHTDKAKFDKAKKKLEELDLSSDTAIKILDIMPKNAFVVKQLVAKESENFGDEQINKILAIIKESK